MYGPSDNIICMLLILAKENNGPKRPNKKPSSALEIIGPSDNIICMLLILATENNGPKRPNKKPSSALEIIQKQAGVRHGER